MKSNVRTNGGNTTNLPPLHLKGLMQLVIEKSKREVSKNRIFKGPYNKIAQSYRKFKALIRPYRSARVFIRKGIDRVEFFEILNARNVQYVLLRWWEDFPEIPEGEDMDILIADNHRTLITDLVTFVDNGIGLKCDIYTLSGSNFGSHKGIPYFQPKLALALLENRIIYRGVYVPSSRTYFASLAYHALFHKGRKSGLPGFGKRYQEAEHDYLKILQSMAFSQKINIDISAKGIFDWLVESEFAPAEDTLSKLVEINPELVKFQKEIYSDIRGGEFIAYVVRNRMLTEGMVEDFTCFLEEEYSFDIIDVRILNPGEKELCTTNIRGGRWDKGPYKLSGGTPAAIVSVFDYHPSPLHPEEQRKQSRMTNRNNFLAKYSYREQLNTSTKSNYNGIHSSDNEHDAWYYVSMLGKEYQDFIFGEVEKRRIRYARKGDLVRTLNHDQNSKVEVVRNGKERVITKTFRSGKEFYLKKELPALKELSEKYGFIPPILEVDEGSYSIPYMENLLEGLPLAQKKAAIKLKKTQILGMIKTLSNRGFKGVSPQKMIISKEGFIYCPDLTYSRLCPLGRMISFRGRREKKADKEQSSLEHLWVTYLDRAIN